MPFAFEQADVRVVADNDVEVAIGADLLEETARARCETSRSSR